MEQEYVNLPKGAHITSIVMTSIAFVLELLALICGIETLTILSQENIGPEGLGAAFLLIYFIILAIAAFGFQAVAIGTSIPCIVKKYIPALHITFLSVNGLSIIVNIIILVVIMMQTN